MVKGRVRVPNIERSKERIQKGKTGIKVSFGREKFV